MRPAPVKAQQLLLRGFTLQSALVHEHPAPAFQLVHLLLARLHGHALHPHLLRLLVQGCELLQQLCFLCLKLSTRGGHSIVALYETCTPRCSGRHMQAPTAASSWASASATLGSGTVAVRKLANATRRSWMAAAALTSLTATHVRNVAHCGGMGNRATHLVSWPSSLSRHWSHTGKSCPTHSDLSKGTAPVRLALNIAVTRCTTRTRSKTTASQTAQGRESRLSLSVVVLWRQPKPLSAPT